MPYTVVRDLAFKQVGVRTLLLDLYLPSGRPPPLGSTLSPDTTVGITVPPPLPLVIWVGGGGWAVMSKHHAESMAAWLTDYGLAVASIEYRVSSSAGVLAYQYPGEATFPAQIQDCKAAVRWLRAHADAYGLDAAHVGAFGDSAGGHLVELLGTTANVTAFESDGVCPDQSSQVQAVCSVYGPSDLGDLPSAAAAVSALLGAAPTDAPDLARWASPLYHVSADSAPHLLIHGDRDTLVPVAHSLRFAEALRRHRVEVMLHVIQGAGHGGAEFWASDEIKRMVARFFLRHLGL